MNTQPRRIKFIDQRLQGRLILVLLGAELALLLAGGTWLWLRLHNLAEDSLYQVHLANQASLLQVLVIEGLKVVGSMVLANLAMLWIIAHLWSRRLGKILCALHGVLLRIQTLRFDGHDENIAEHPVVARCDAWQRHERSRHQALDHEVTALEGLAASHGPERPDAFARHLRRCEDLLRNSGTMDSSTTV